MKHVTMMRGTQVLRGWIEDRGARVGAKVQVKEQGDGLFTVTSASSFSQDEAAVKKREDEARKPFTAMKAYRGVEK